MADRGTRRQHTSSHRAPAAEEALHGRTQGPMYYLGADDQWVLGELVVNDQWLTFEGTGSETVSHPTSSIIRVGALDFFNYFESNCFEVTYAQPAPVGRSRAASSARYGIMNQGNLAGIGGLDSNTTNNGALMSGNLRSDRGGLGGDDNGLDPSSVTAQQIASNNANNTSLGADRQSPFGHAAGPSPVSGGAGGSMYAAPPLSGASQGPSAFPNMGGVPHSYEGGPMDTGNIPLPGHAGGMMGGNSGVAISSEALLGGNIGSGSHSLSHGPGISGGAPSLGGGSINVMGGGGAVVTVTGPASGNHSPPAPMLQHGANGVTSLSNINHNSALVAFVGGGGSHQQHNSLSVSVQGNMGGFSMTAASVGGGGAMGRISPVNSMSAVRNGGDGVSVTPMLSPALSFQDVATASRGGGGAGQFAGLTGLSGFGEIPYAFPNTNANNLSVQSTMVPISPTTNGPNAFLGVVPQQQQPSERIVFKALSLSDLMTWLMAFDQYLDVAVLNKCGVTVPSNSLEPSDEFGRLYKHFAAYGARLPDPALGAVLLDEQWGQDLVR